MNMLSSGDLVKPKLGGPEMIVVGVADFHRDRPEALSVFCVWDENHFLHEEVFQTKHLALIRKERRRAVRRTDAEYRACAPSQPTAGIELQDVSLSMDGQRVTFYVQVATTARKFALISAGALTRAFPQTGGGALATFETHRRLIKLAGQRKMRAYPGFPVLILHATDFE
jgi:uncharacterized protein YodC (DUF2158 family)